MIFMFNIQQTLQTKLSQISKGHFAFVIGEDNNGDELHKKLFFGHPHESCRRADGLGDLEYWPVP